MNYTDWYGRAISLLLSFSPDKRSRAMEFLEALENDEVPWEGETGIPETEEPALRHEAQPPGEPSPKREKPPACPRCGSEATVRNGHALNGVQRYICKPCKRVFTDTTNTVRSHSQQDLEVWERFISLRAEGLSLAKIARELGISEDTAIRMKRKLLSGLELEKGRQASAMGTDDISAPDDRKGSPPDNQ